MDSLTFVAATRKKLRFASPIGILSVEDLWDLPLTTTRSNKPSLEAIGNDLLARQQQFAATSILSSTTPSPEKDDLDLAVAVVRYIVQVKEAESAARTAAAAKASEKARLDAIIAAREAKELPLDDLKAQRAALDT